jgi:vitamin B12 transporter
VNAYAHYALARDWRLEMRANNILDKDYEASRGYATAGANVFVGVRYAPR